MSTTIIDADSHGRKRYIILFTTAALLVLGALWGAKQAGHEKDTRMRRELVRQAVAVAAAVPIDEASALSFTIDDLARPEYTRLCAMFKAWSDLTGLESIYTMKLRDDGRFVFGPESLEPDSPGEVYQQPTEQDFLPFQTGEPVVVGPFTDEYGTFVSALAPVIQPRTGEVLFTVGIDIEAAEWTSEIRRVQWIPLLTVLLPLAVLFIGGVLIKRRSRTSPESTHLRHHTEATVCAIISLVLTLIATLFVSREERILRRDAFYSAAQFKAKGHAEYFHSTSETLGMLAVFFESSEEITAEEFRTVCAPILRRNAIEGCIWCPEVAAEEQSAFETGMSAAGYTGFSIRPLPDTDGNAPTEKLYPALYVEPAEIAEEARGYNLASEPVRRAALLEARETGQITATDPIRLAALPDRPQGIFLFCPVNAVTQKGVLALVFRPEKNMQSLARQARSETVGMKTCLLQMQSGSPPQTLYCLDGQTAADCAVEVPEELRSTFPVFVFGKPYALLITPDEQWLAANPLRHTDMTLFSGLILSTLFTALIAVLANRPRLLERQVLQRTAELRKSEERFEIAADAGGIGIWDRDIANDQLFWDDRMYTIYGIRKQDFGGAYEAWQQCVHPDDLERTTDEVTAAEKGEKNFDTQFRIVRPDGETRHIRAFGNVIRDRNGVPVRMLGTNQDISRHVLAEQKRKQSEEQFRSTVNDLLVGVVVHHADTSIAFSNPQAQNILGLSAEQIAGKTAVDPAWHFVHEDLSKMDVNDYPVSRVATTGEKLSDLTLGIEHPDREEITWVTVSGIPVFDGHKNLQRIIINFIDITDRKKAEAALVKSRELMQSALDGLSAHIALLDETGTVLLVNKAWRDFAVRNGADVDAACEGINYVEVCTNPASADQKTHEFAVELQRVLDGRQNLFSMEYPCITGEKDYWFNVRVSRIDHGDQRRIVVFHTDITELHIAEQKLKESESKLRGIVENSTNMFYSHTPEHVLTYVSPQVKDILGYEVDEALVRWTELASDHPDNERGFKLTEEAIRSGKTQSTYECQLIHKDSHPVWVEVREAPVVEDGKTVSIVGSLNDITERKKAEEELNQKMDELERFNHVAVGRELRMIELKNEINRLCRELGQEPPYPSIPYPDQGEHV